MFRWAVLGLVALVLLIGAFFGYKVLSGTERAVEEAKAFGRALPEIAEAFQSQNITTTFQSALPELASTGTGNLEVATATVVETVTRADERKVLWDRFSLGETVVELRVPVTYRYHVRLDDPWELEAQGSVCVVKAPAIRPSLPPAIHTDRLERLSRSTGWLPSDPELGFDELERTLTPLLSEYAGDPNHLEAAREESRRTITRFVRNWLLREGQWSEERFQWISVQFPGEQRDGHLSSPAPAE
ncbi:hypothetical protein ABI59_13915 [Acidobacteria bacterium Mor1]|nr:hypothetical protein ABI59_13915 [Acidobacteria bacterium Mor1]